jgi:hypothetical protein
MGSTREMQLSLPTNKQCVWVKEIDEGFLFSESTALATGDLAGSSLHKYKSMSEPH